VRQDAWRRPGFASKPSPFFFFSDSLPLVITFLISISYCMVYVYTTVRAARGIWMSIQASTPPHGNNLGYQHSFPMIWISSALFGMMHRNSKSYSPMFWYQCGTPSGMKTTSPLRPHKSRRRCRFWHDPAECTVRARACWYGLAFGRRAPLRIVAWQNAVLPGQKSKPACWSYLPL